ncbi:MAG TPA: amidohydrolase family protein, partial [Pyrinomonadaceae bacterium]
LINLAGDTAQQMILRTPVALSIGFTPLRTGSYPASLMGVFSALRQMLLDAGRYREAQAVYEKSPRGLRRPEQDKSLAALVPVLSRELPVIMLANSEREITRALDLAEEFKLRLIIAGGAESWKLTDRLRAMDVPVLLSLNFPKRTTTQNAEADPEPLRLLRERIDAPKTAARLAQARVRFAFQSGAMTEMAGYLANAAKAIENGLGRDEALRALTLRPAEIFGVSDRLGTLEVGKIANLTITRGDIFDRGTTITHVFIDGRPVELKPATTATGTTATASGTWTLNVNLGEGETVLTLILQQEGGQLRGSIQGAFGSGQIANASTAQSGELSFSVPVNLGGLTTEATFNGTITGNTMRGTIQVVGRAPGSFTGTRAGAPAAAPAPNTRQPAPKEAASSQQPAVTLPAAPALDPSGTWNINFVVGEQTVPATLLIERRGAILMGTLEGPFPTAEIMLGSNGADGFRFTSLVKLGGENVELTFEGKVVNRNEGVNDAAGARPIPVIEGTVTSTLGTVEFTGTRPRTEASE